MYPAMRIRIIIDTQDSDDPEAVRTRAPFTLNIYKDDEDGTPSRESLEINTEAAIVGDDIALMMDELRIAWMREAVLGQDDQPLPRTGDQWRVHCNEEAP